MARPPHIELRVIPFDHGGHAAIAGHAAGVRPSRALCTCEPHVAVFLNESTRYEGVPRVEAFCEPMADQMSVMLRVCNDVALHSEWYPKSISVISGTGLVAPTF